MKATLVLFLTAALLLMTAHRLPAPISEAPETTPTPKAKREAPPRPKPKSKQTPKSKATPTSPFAGNWTGTALGVARTFPLSDKNSSTYSIGISPDGTRISVEETRNPYGNVRQGPIACRNEGNALAWNYEQQVDRGYRMSGRCILRINPDGTAALLDEREYQGWVKLTLKITATLTKQ